MSQVFFNRNIADECHQQIRAFINAGNEVVRIAFAPGGGNRFSVVAKNGAFLNRNIPDECHQKMGELSKNGAKIICVAFPPGGGNSWSIVNDKGAYFNRGIPDECHQKMAELSQNGAKIISVAFPPSGGNSWSIVNDKGAYFNRNIPDECHQKMAEFSQNGARVICVAFDKDGTGWSVINNQGAYFNRNIPDEAHMIMGYYSQIYGAISLIAFDGDANGWSILGTKTKDEKVCDANRCVDISDVYANIQQRLDGKVVGYACTVGAGSIGAYSHGYARTSANSPAKLYLPSTKSPTASVSKFVTALAAIALLAKKNISLDTKIANYLPSHWTPHAKMGDITFRQLMSHRSGIKDYGNNDQSYETIKSFWENPPVNAFKPDDKNPEYSNYNFGIFRMLLPHVDGSFVDDPQRRAEKYAASYIRLVQQYVFEKVGAFNVDAKPPTSGPQASGYAFSYQFPGTSSGFNWGDNTLGVGAACWYLSIDDVAKVLYSLNSNDGRILTSAQRTIMENDSLGFDTRTDGNGYRWCEKNGGWGMNGTTISTSVCLFGPGVFGGLFINSDTANAGPGADTVLHDALVAAYKPRP
jgi:CubicO group peptidase (beta-lactamase class C family)